MSSSFEYSRSWLAFLSWGIVLTFSLSSAECAGETITDNFSTNNDYLTNLGVWSGVDPGVVSATSSGGVLSITGGYLYINVPDSSDFTATVDFASGPTSTNFPYPASYMSVTSADESVQTQVFGAVAGWMGWSPQNVWIWGINTGIFQIQRTADVYSAWYWNGSQFVQDGSQTYTNAALDGAVRVGLGAVGGTATAEFSNFSLSIASSPPPPTSNLAWAGQTSGDGLWTTAANWTNSVIPGAGSVAVFSNSSATQTTVDLGASNVTVAGLTFNGTSTTSTSRGSVGRR